MRVCVISGSYPPMRDGVGDYTYRFFTELERQLGDDNAVLITTEVGPVPVPRPKRLHTVGSWGFRDVGRVVRAVRAAHPDVISLQYPAAGYARHMGATFMPWLLRWRCPGVPMVATLHEFTSRTFKGRCRLLASLYPCARIIIVNPMERFTVGTLAPRLVKRMRYVPVGPTVFAEPVTSQEAAVLKERLGMAGCGPILAYFGVLRPTKGLEELVEGFRAARVRLPNARLLLLGHADEGYLSGRLAPLMAKAGLADKVVLSGRCTDSELSQYLGITDLCVLPYPDGVTPRRTSFMAALQTEQAIITTRPAYRFEEIRDGENALLVPPGDSVALADAIVRLAGDDALRARLRRGAAELKGAFRWDRIVAAIVSVFGEVTALTEPGQA